MGGVLSGWLPTNPASKIKPPKTSDTPTLPLSDAEVEKLLSACDAYPHKGRALRMRALILLLRYSGLRIGDAATLSRNRITDDKLELYTAKTGTKVCLPLPPKVIEALHALPVKGEHFFWSGKSKVRTVTGRWQTDTQEVVRKVRIAGCPSAQIPGHVRGSAYGACIHPARASLHPCYRKALRRLGTLSPGAARAGRSGDLGADCTSPCPSP